jgi:hypothetical protein
MAFNGEKLVLTVPNRADTLTPLRDGTVSRAGVITIRAVFPRVRQRD